MQQPLHVGDVMTRRVEVIGEHEVGNASALVQRFRRFHHLPVVDGQKHVVGVLTPNDVLHDAVAHPRAKVKVRDVMSAPPETIGELELVETAAERMTARRIHALPVTRATGELVGVITSSDLLRALAGREATAPTGLQDLPVDEVMTHDPVTVVEDASIGEAAAVLAETGVRHLPVVNRRGQLAGMLFERDLREFLRNDVMRWPDADEDLLTEPVTAVMVPNPTAIRSGTTLGAALTAFADERLTGVPVIADNDKVLGILSYVDVLDWLREHHGPEPARGQVVPWSIDPP